LATLCKKKRLAQRRKDTKEIIPNFAVGFKESDKIMMQNTGKLLPKKQGALSGKNKRMKKIIRQDEQD